jgi:hypothetical protein
MHQEFGQTPAAAIIWVGNWVGDFSAHRLEVIDFCGAPGVIRTPDLLVRSPKGYRPTKLHLSIISDLESDRDSKNGSRRS